MSQLSFYAAFALTTALAAADASACSCAPPPAIADAARTAAAIFVGKAIEIGPGASKTESVITFAVERAFHGAEPNSDVKLRQESMCGFNFEKSGRYLVYAGLDASQRYTASLCSRTKVAKKIGRELRTLAKLPQAGFSQLIRKVKPLDPNEPACVEMYSDCQDSAQGPLCRSAPYDLACGEVGQAPGGDPIRCACKSTKRE